MAEPKSSRAVRVDVERLTVVVVELVRLTAVQRARIAAYMHDEAPFSDYEAAAKQWQDTAYGFARLVHPRDRLGLDSARCFALVNALLDASLHEIARSGEAA